MGGRGASAGKGAGTGAGGADFTRSNTFDNELFGKLPKKLQVKNIVDIGKDKTVDGTRYRAVIMFDDGFSRSIGEYTLKDFKNYIEDVLADRTVQY